MASHLSAIELLKRGDDDRIKPYLNQYWPYVLGSTLGFCTGMLINFGTKRPIYSGLQKHAACMAIWSASLHIVQKKRDAYFAERDAVLRHYIELHPEDFVEPERKKLADVLEPWIPIR
ncbi:hypothetical protein JYU34_008733 [Plutella xylostella]|uniref:NADH dehydrogenase [ubiquinone] 1 subunit C2 n=1 Tax=Plutella xylostella TaxID=51655 RepID=A0ABQ7QLS9_PLUXY|nr:NADH dehydrogenase [ubiquinone] 1 subunit C2 [Plutella xylostella]KAG7306141.1 hypothetical protein JYU34_008733 [Plutella xylostella]